MPAHTQEVLMVEQLASHLKACTGLLAMQVYVQDLIQANGAKLWPLFEAGAVVYVCGDARRMVSQHRL
jgi:sulfite reductase alpha subunit-like flavoprotein